MPVLKVQTPYGWRKVGCGGTSYLSAVLADTPYLLWELGEASGSTATDASGNSRAGSYVNAPTLAAAGPPVGGTALQHDGVNDAVTRTAVPPLYAVEMWVYLPAQITPASSPYGLWWSTASGAVPRQGVFVGGSATGDVSDEVLTYIQSDGVTQESVAYGATSATIEPGWHLIVAAYRASLGRFRLFLDGAPIDNQAVNGAGPIGGGDLCIGGYQPGVNPFVSGGGIAWVAGYTAELSDARILAHWEAFGRLKVWDGTQWMRARCDSDGTGTPLKLWDGTTWQTVACMVPA